MKRFLKSLALLLTFITASASIPKGTVITDTLWNSDIYPGTMREYKIYIPQQYDASRPACLYLGLDGILYNATAVMDTLIASGEIPVMIGVFVQPGVITDNDGSVIRYNRSNEFDRTDGKFAHFIESELLPAVETHKTPDGLPILISKDANDRAISGASSSGIASFNTTFWRPDLFSRIYSTCGTFVAMRGGNELPALIRKTEPRPVRVFLHDGSQDAWNPLFGHWYEQNLLTASALEFAGYELKTVWDDGNHSIKNGSKIFPEAMRYLWQGYPERVKTGTSQNNMLTALLIPGENWVEACDTLPATTSGTSALSPDGKVFTETEPDSDWLVSYTIAADGAKSNGQQFYWIHNPLHRDQQIIGMIYASDGNLFVATEIGIQVCDHNGRVRAILPYPVATSVEAFSFEGNCLYITSQGKTYRRRVNATAHPATAPRIQYKSQGQG